MKKANVAHKKKFMLYCIVDLFVVHDDEGAQVADEGWKQWVGHFIVSVTSELVTFTSAWI